MRIAEIHSSDLTDPCMRRVYHRHMGEITGVATTALYRGLVAGKALELLHNDGFKQGSPNLVVAAASETEKQLSSENRIISESVEEGRQDILAEVTAVVDLYRNRFEPLFAECGYIGSEVPVRLDTGFGRFASHLDLLVRDKKGLFGYGKDRLVVIDWKWRKETPSRSYLVRNFQFMLYYLMVRNGITKVFDNGDELDWISFSEAPVVVWCHLPSLKPYSRKTVGKNDEGEEKEYKRGDERPLRSVFKSVEYGDGQIDEMKKELELRAKMIEQDIFPLNPDPVGCMLCEAESFCRRFDMTDTLRR